jgi:rubrerythrin
MKHSNALVLASLKKAETEAVAEVKKKFAKLRKSMKPKKHTFVVRFTEGDEKVDFSKIENHTPKQDKWKCPSCDIEHSSDAFRDGWGCFDSQCMH